MDFPSGAGVMCDDKGYPFQPSVESQTSQVSEDWESGEDEDYGGTQQSRRLSFLSEG